EAGTRRVIAQSYAGAGPDKRPGPVKTEDDPPEWRPIRSAMQGPAAIAHAAKTVPAQALEGLVLRYGGCYRPGASAVLVDMVRKRAWLGRLLAGEFVVAQMTSSRGYSNEKAKKELGWEPRYASWREGFRAWVSG